ncbi:DNA-binding Xre family transcriptional regulator [Bacillus niacini]|uniref:DNA-binding Xre family transcriptional regulator n=1 Tax=Neobacillus niacini TaxID=86668 RepID=A0A852THV0_9BACI|nr:helix-turn-helix transcriptional regulator [Neobacillus niacini]NYE07306.1 DNA-binding Xre family transcriptional regulator [Neobacillus niacini]
MRRVEIKLKDLLNERGIEQKKLAEMTGLTERTISELVNNKVKRVPKEALEKIADALDIDKMSDILTFVNEETAE